MPCDPLLSFEADSGHIEGSRVDETGAQKDAQVRATGGLCLGVDSHREVQGEEAMERP